MVKLCWFLQNDLSPRFKWFRNKKQFKDLPSSTRFTSSDRIALDLNGFGLQFNARWGHILYFCCHIVKPLMPILPLLANSMFL